MNIDIEEILEELKQYGVPQEIINQIDKQTNDLSQQVFDLEEQVQDMENNINGIRKEKDTYIDRQRQAYITLATYYNAYKAMFGKDREMTAEEHKALEDTLLKCSKKESEINGML